MQNTAYPMHPPLKAPIYPAIFLDRDGTLHRDVGYLIDFAHFEPLPGVLEALRILQEKGYRLFVTSNQSGIARGYFTLDQVLALNDRIRRYFAEEGVDIEEFVICPHHPEGKVESFRASCQCRKPEPGMILYLQKKYNLDLNRSYAVGDKESDALAGLRAGARGVWLRQASVPTVDTVTEYLEFQSLLDFARDTGRVRQD